MKDRAFESYSTMLKRIHEELEKRTNNALKPFDLTKAQMDVLLLLREAENGTLSLKQVEKASHVAQSTVSGIVARLEKKSLVQRLNEMGDRRVKKVRITEKGRKCCMDALRSMRDTERELLSILTKEEQAMFESLLGKVNSGIPHALPPLPQKRTMQ